MEKLDVDKLRGEYHDLGLDKEGRVWSVDRGDDTNQSFEAIGNKINEIVDWVNRQEENAR